MDRVHSALARSIPGCAVANRADDLLRLLRWSSREGFNPGERVLMVRMEHPTKGKLVYSRLVTAKDVALHRRPIDWLWAIVLMMQDIMVETAQTPSPDNRQGVEG